MSRFVIAAYAPKPGKEQGLLEAIRKHVPVLRREGLVTERPAYLMKAKDGTVVEVFEWLSPEAIQRAHSNPSVLALWEEFGEVCDFKALSSLAETSEMFAEFTPVVF
jgi:hypothetical protein